MADTLLRHWQMLSLIPRAPRKVDTATLESQLAGRGFTVDRRSIQRDLLKLSAHFALVVDDRNKPFGWSWARAARVFDIPGMDLHTALAFALAAEHLAHLLPRATLEYMGPHFTHAQAVLDQVDDNDLATWRNSVRVLPKGQPMLPPQVASEVLEGLHNGLLHQRQLDITYRVRGAAPGEGKPRIVHPLGLVYRDAVAYLLCTMFDYQDIRQLAVHRIESLQVRAEKRAVPDHFDLDAYIASGEFGFRMGLKPLNVELLFAPLAAIRLLETPLSHDQQIHRCADERVNVTATVADTVALRVWIKGYGPLCEVVQPRSLREEIAADHAAAAAQYL